MNKKGTLELSLPSDREIAMTRVFDAPRDLVYDALTKPELLKRWLGVMPGWSWMVCDIDLRPGGAYRYAWRGPNGEEMGLSGTFKEAVRPERVVATEKYDQAWYPGGATSSWTLVESGEKTTLTLTVKYDTKEARDAVLASPMKSGVESGYDHLATMLAEILSRKGK